MLNLLKSPLISSLTINISPLKFTFLSKAKLVEEKLKLQTSHAKKEDNFFNNNKKKNTSPMAVLFVYCVIFIMVFNTP